MAAGAQGDQVRIVIRALLAAQLLVMDLQVLSGTTDLALPAIAAQYLFSELFVELGMKSLARALGRIPFTMPPRSLHVERPAVGLQEGI